MSKGVYSAEKAKTGHNSAKRLFNIIIVLYWIFNIMNKDFVCGLDSKEWNAIYLLNMEQKCEMIKKQFNIEYRNHLITPQ